MASQFANFRHLAFRRRFVLGAVVLLLSSLAAVPMARSLSGSGWSVLKISFFAVFLVLLARVVFGFVAAVIGWWLLLSGRDTVRINRLPPEASTVELPATAVVMPIHNEDVSRVFQGLRIMYEAVQKTGHGAAFDFFILSDTNDLNGWIAEEKAWFELCKQVQGFGRIFYRKRRVLRHHKSGNIADFCRRWGAGYRYMIVLDADSVMTGDLFIRLARLMEHYPRVGIIQTTPRTVLGRSLFQRIEQFAAYVYRPIFATGENFWQMGSATYWGHNAIVRLKPFMRYCAMPELPEVGPLGTRILSHDTIEAALMQRAGYAVWQACDLEGSYEESPPNLLASLQRDRRWCHGNLQHAWFLFERGLKPVSRFNIFNGIMIYASAPLWLLSIILGLLVAMENGGGAGATVGGGLVPAILFASIMGLLLLPKALGAWILLRQPEKLALAGGRAKVALGVAAETLYSPLLASILMLHYTRFVLASFSGGKVSWGRQLRSDDHEPDWSAWFGAHWRITAAAAASGAVVAWLAPLALLWLSPVLAGPLLAIPLSRLTASNRLGLKARMKGWFAIPEEQDPPTELKRIGEPFLTPANPFFRAREYAPDYGLLQAVLDPYVNAIHVSLLRQRKEGSQRTREFMAFLADRLLLEGPLALTIAEKKILLWDAESMLAMHQKLWSSPGSHLHEWWQAAFRRYNETSAIFIRRSLAPGALSAWTRK